MDARRTISTDAQDCLDSDSQSVALLVKITRQDSVVLGFTTHDKDLTVGGVTYEALSGITASALRTEIGTGIDNAEITGALTSDKLTEDDLLGERYDLATIEMWWLPDWENLSIAPVKMYKGVLGRVTLEQGQFKTELRSLEQFMDQQVLRLCAAECSATGQLGEPPCNADLTGKTFAVTGVSGDSETVRVSGTGIIGQETGFFSYGRLVCLAGANAGITRELKSTVDDGSDVVCTLCEPFPFDPAAGDTYTLRVGCDGQFATCHSRFDNAVNFQGFPHLPGTQKVLQQGRTS